MINKTGKNHRIDSIDIVRGLVMVIMALDHARDFFHINSLTQDPANLATTTPALFFTRWITHLCAPTFVFLSGVSAYLSYKRKNDLQAARLFLLKRGVWLLFLELTLVNFGVWFDIHFQNFLFSVIGAIGVGFIILAALMGLKTKIIGMIGILIILLHDLIPSIPLGTVFGSLFLPKAFPIGHSLLIIAYPVIPWTGIMLAGYAAAIYFMNERKKRTRFFLLTGLFLLLFFTALRLLNFYGDPVLWQPSDNFLHSVLSFINVTKYPPSLLFISLMLGIMFLLLAVAERLGRRIQAFLTVYGKVPLFYYLIHWYILHPLLLIVLLFQGFSTDQFVFGSNFGRPKAASGLTLGEVYLVWISVVVLLYPICRWYGRYKSSHPEKKWLHYL